MSANANLFSISDTALETAGAICFADEFLRLVVVSNLIVNFRTRQCTCFAARPNRNRFHGGESHNRPRPAARAVLNPRRRPTQAPEKNPRDDVKDTRPITPRPARR